MIDDEFTFYLNHQKELVEGRLDEFVVRVTLRRQHHRGWMLKSEQIDGN